MLRSRREIRADQLLVRMGAPLGIGGLAVSALPMLVEPLRGL